MDLIFQIAIGTMLGGLFYEIFMILVGNLINAVMENKDGGDE